MVSKTKSKTRSEAKPKTVRPLSGVRVLDLTHLAASPFGMLLLALFGAEIIKIEPLDQRKKPGTYSGGLAMNSKTYILTNHSKNGVTLNLKSDMGREMFLEMVKKADVVVEDFKLGVMERLGIGYDVLKEVNPRIIYASNKGFGRSGPYRDYPAYDATVQAMAGAFSVNGFPGNPPCKVGPAIGDWCTGMYLAMGIMGALRLRDTTGKGRMLETSMQESVATLLIDHYQMYMEYNQEPGRRGNAPYAPRLDLFNPRAVYECTDGYIYVTAADDKQWESVLKVIGREDLIGDPRFADRVKRCENNKTIDGLIEEWTRKRTKREAFDKFCTAGAAAGMVLNLQETLGDPHMNERGFFKEIEHPVAGKVKVFGLPIKYSDAPTDAIMSSPLAGQDNARIYRELLGYAEEELTSLAEQGVI